MILIQSILDAHGVWKKLQEDRYTMTVSKLCNRLCSRAGIRNEYASALRKHGSIVIDRQGQLVKMEIKLEEKDDRHKFTGDTKVFASRADAAPSESSEVHAGRGSAGADEQPGSVSSGT